MIAAIYARKSTDQTGIADDQKSVARQIEHARAYAETKGWIVADEHVYVDDGISGAEFANRPGFVRLMNALKPRAAFQVLVMSEESRLGREAIETAYALKQLVQAGVRVFFYLENRERTLDSPTDKIMLSLTAFADELEREKARQRTYDAMVRIARSGHVTGGALFGYENVDVLGPGGTRSHVQRRIEPEQAAVLRELFEQYAAGAGVRTIAKRLNDAGRVSPRSQQGRPRGWSPSSVWEALHRPVYSGEIVWNRSRKRDKWGTASRSSRTEADWIHVPAPELRIVPDSLWQAVQARAAAARATYIRSTGGVTFGRPPNTHESRHLLTGFARCGECGASILVRSRDHGRRRQHFYACSAFHRRGRAICANSLDVKIERADAAILTDIERFVLHPKVVQRAIVLALEELRPSADRDANQRDRLARERTRVEGELQNLTRAIAAGGDVPTLVAALRAAEARRAAIQTELGATNAVQTFTTATATEYKQQILDKLAGWRVVLRQAPQEARTILRQLMAERLTLTPTEADGERLYAYRGKFTIGGLFEGILRPRMLASPPGFEPGFWP